MKIDIGTYVKHCVYDNVYRYGIVVAMGHGPLFNYAKVAWTARREHPVGKGIYVEKVDIMKLEVMT
jgi:hypothetical protein